MIYIMNTGEKVKVVNTYAYMGADGKAVICNNLKVISGVEYVPAPDGEDSERKTVIVPAGAEYMLTNSELQRNGNLVQ